MNYDADLGLSNYRVNRYQQRYDVPVIANMLHRGDEGMAREDWSAAESCYLAAYYCAGGHDALIKTKIDLVRDILHVVSVVGSAETRIASAHHTPAAIEVILEELITTQRTLYDLITELPGSHHLPQLAEQLKTAIIIAKTPQT